MVGLRRDDKAGSEESAHFRLCGLSVRSRGGAGAGPSEGCVLRSFNFGIRTICLCHAFMASRPRSFLLALSEGRGGTALRWVRGPSGSIGLMLHTTLANRFNKPLRIIRHQSVW